MDANSRVRALQRSEAITLLCTMAPHSCDTVQLFIDYNTAVFLDTPRDWSFLKNVDWRLIDHKLSCILVKHFRVIRILPDLQDYPLWDEDFESETLLPNFDLVPVTGATALLLSLRVCSLARMTGKVDATIVRAPQGIYWTYLPVEFIVSSQA